jgi:hypothetical protein
MGKILIIVSLFFLTCEIYPSKTTNPQGYVKLNYYPGIGDSCPYQTVEIDSCEYIFVGAGNASWGSHKGNCKFCKERNKKNCQ